MELVKIDTNAARPADSGVVNLLLAKCLAAAAQGCENAYFDLGVAFSTSSHGATCDLVEAHKWFNLAALSGSTRGQECRAEVALEMTAREIADAQRQARAWLGTTQQRYAA